MSSSAAHLSANKQVCVGSGLCAFVAPRYFDVSSGAVEVLEETVDDADADAVTEAVDACPTQALRLGAGATSPTPPR